MINISEIRTSLFGVVGLQQSYNPAYAILAADLIASTSGAYFNQYSSYMTVENLKSTQPYADISDANFNIWLRSVITNSISTAIQKCFKIDLFENALLYDRSIRKSTTLDNDGDFVGYEIIVSKRKDMKSFINKAILDFSGTGTVKLLLFHDSQVDPLQEQEVTISDNSSTEVALNWGLDYGSVQGGKYYLGYLTDGLTPKAFERDYEDSNVSHQYTGVGLFPVKVTGWNSETMFDISDVVNVSETFGLNFDISSYKDYTNLVVNNKDMFIDVIGYQFAADMLGMMMTSIQTNGIERIGKGNLLIELQGGFINEELPTVVGVNTKLQKAIKEVQRNLIDTPLIQKFTAK